MTTLQLGQALRNAIEAEKAAKRFYELLAESTEDADAKSFLEKMAREENRHAKQLEEYVSKAVELTIPDLPDENVEAVETMREWAYVDDISYENALAIALEAELHAALYYSTIADCMEPGTGRALFETIARTEEKHAANLRSIKG